MKKMLILLLFCSHIALGQQIPGYGFDKIRITEDGQTIQAELKPVSADPEFFTDRFYYWCSGSHIHFTQGGFSGRLLNGSYFAYYLNKNLKEKGIFKKGLKDGMWQSWNDNGTLIESYTWVKGIKSGKFSLFDDHGYLKQSGEYQKNQLEGPVKNYSGNEPVKVINYHNGVVIANEPVTFWAKINIFEKKNKQPVINSPKTKVH